jgi:uncharacterized damage-inducible protein DinB
MKKVLLPFSLFLLVCSSVVSAQQAKPANETRTVTSILDNSLTSVESEFAPAAEAMPEDKYGFVPSNGEFKGVRSFAQQVKHVAAVNFLIAAALLEEKPPVETGGESGPDALKTKAEIVKYLKDSFTYAHKAFATISEKNAGGSVQSPFGDGTASRLGLATIIVGHCFDHYGQMVVYLRTNGVIPPASRPR